MEKEGFETKKGILLDSCERDKSDGGAESSDIKESSIVNNQTALSLEGNKCEKEELKNVSSHDGEVLKLQSEVSEVDVPQVLKDGLEKESFSEVRELDAPTDKKMGEETVDAYDKNQAKLPGVGNSVDVREKSSDPESGKRSHELKEGVHSDTDSDSKILEQGFDEGEEEPVFDGTEVFEMEGERNTFSQSLNNDSEGQVSAWPEKAVALTNFVRQKSLIAVSTVLRRLSGKSDDGQVDPDEYNNWKRENSSKEDGSFLAESDAQKVSNKSAEKSVWNPLNLVRISRGASGEDKSLQVESIEDLTHPIAMKGRIILYTRLRCLGCKETRRYLHGKRLRYVEINIDVYPNRKQELEKISGSSAVPKVFFNEVLIGGLMELKILEESGKLDEKVEYVITEPPPYEAPLPPLSGEDDLSSSGAIDELALIVRKMKGSISIKDRFYKMRRFTNCFIGSESVDFLSQDQYLEREDAVEFGRKLGNKLFFRHVTDENTFEDGNHLYRFLDDDPLVSQCQNITRGIAEAKPKAITEISSRLRFLSCAILEAYASEDGNHLDYRSIHGSEEFARYLRITEELQRVELSDMTREEKLSFFINLYNMTAIHAILVSGHPSGALERRKFFGDFKYVIGGSTYSLSGIYNGILRGNQRPPYNLIKQFRMNDKRLKVALPYPEPLVHFALVSGTRSGPALRCYSPGNIDQELIESARNFLRTGGLYIDLTANVAYVSKILKWYGVDFGKNEMEVLKHAANYLDATESQALLDLLSKSQLKVIYQPFDWGLNH
ncbi:LOW QUALITY PROTEIN: uncharacterized protein LOC142551421 [Primulina tabacum]|uniref:LOW QUALITY PROTEIN: uncharacterized protein LOC142551421 n=1 Tax=Primulina tabacum TaxID=48773 RepID=UPI003F594C56